LFALPFFADIADRPPFATLLHLSPHNLRNRLPETPNPALECPHLTRRRSTLLRRQFGAFCSFRNVHPLAFNSCLMQPITFPIKQAERRIMPL
jgi:hypothetical protein